MDEKTKSEKKKRLKEIIKKSCVDLGHLLDDGEKYSTSFSEPNYVQILVWAKD